MPQPNSVPLFAVAGLPRATEVLCQLAIEDAFDGPFRVVSVRSATNGARLYPHSYVDHLAIAMAEFAKKQRKASADLASPSSIRLLYVPSDDDERLLSAFDFSVFPVALQSLAEFDDRGKCLRHDRDAVMDALARAVQPNESADETFNRVKLVRRKDPLLLPPLNFHVDRSARMAEFLREMRRGYRDWKDRFEELAPRSFTSESIPRLAAGRSQQCFQDSRSIVFVQPHASGYHGATWERDELDREAAIDALRALYRFGGPLPSGFQHDAQFEGGAAFKDQEFESPRQGTVRVTGSHANIYPNDFVRRGS